LACLILPCGTCEEKLIRVVPIIVILGQLVPLVGDADSFHCLLQLPPGVLVLVVIGIVTATAMDTPSPSHTHWGYMRMVWRYGDMTISLLDKIRSPATKTFAYVALAFPMYPMLLLPVFLCFHCLYILRDVRISLLLQRAARQLQHIVALPSASPLHLWKCFPRCFPSLLFPIFRSCFVLYFDVLVDSGRRELKQSRGCVGYEISCYALNWKPNGENCKRYNHM